MNQDLQKLIGIAKEGDEITAKQREIILKKAQELGEDLDEVEMVLESIQSKQVAKEPVRKNDERRKCPNCGAIINDSVLVCPECGYVLQQENKASKEAREAIERLQDSLSAVTKSSSSIFSQSAQYKKSAAIVNAFLIPTTKEGLMLFLEFAYSNYISLGQDGYSKPLKDAWYSKTIQVRNSLERLGGDDPEIKAILDRYSSLISIEKKKKTKKGFLTKLLYAVIIYIALNILISVIILLALPIFEDQIDDQVIQAEIETCLQNNDFVGARAAAIKASDTASLLDEISVQEVSFLIKERNYEQAKIVASGIEDKGKKEAVLTSIQNVEKQSIDNN